MAATLLTGTASTLSLAELADVAQAAWQEHHLVPDGVQHQLHADVRDLVTAAEGRGARDLRDLLAHAAHHGTQGCGVDSLTRYAGADASDRAHRVRNALGALATGAAIAAQDDPMCILRALPALSPRAGGKERATRCDEIIMLRHAALHAAVVRSRGRIVATQYALVESGALPSETTVVTPSDFDDPRQPTEVKLPGVRGRVAERVIPLGPYATAVLRKVLDTHLARNSGAMTQPLAYNGDHPGGNNAASASASGNLKRLMRGAGLTDPQLVPMSITRWRIQRIVERHGLAAAKAIAGTNSYDKLVTFVNVPIHEPAPRPTGRGYA